MGPLEAILVVHHGDTSNGLFLALTQSSFSVPFHTVHRVPAAKYWSGLPFPPPVAHVLLEFLTMTCLSWVAHQDS